MEAIHLERLENGVALITLCRPETRNALTTEVREGLSQIFTDLTKDPDMKCAVITGGEIFAAGADIKGMAQASPIDLMERATHKFWEPIAQFPKPLIAAVNGYALGGGCELAMHADIIFAGQNAQFGQPEVKLGIMPGAGGTQRLIRAIGKFRAMPLLLTGDLISATEAYNMGLVTKVVSDNETLDAALHYAEKIAKRPALAVQQIKEVALAGMDESLDVALRLERKAFQLLFSTQDQKEGMAAFIEKRKPEFTGA